MNLYAYITGRPDSTHEHLINIGQHTVIRTNNINRTVIRINNNINDVTMTIVTIQFTQWYIKYQ